MPDTATMSIKELAELVDKIGRLATTEGFVIKVQIYDVRHNFGELEALVIPVDGFGEKWIKMFRITNIA